MKFAIGGAAFSGNKGAEGMLLSLIRNLSKADPQAEFLVLSYYPLSDSCRKLPESVTILDGSPRRVVVNFFLSCWALFCRFLHLPAPFRPGGEFRKIAGCDLFLDAAGISFCDGREKFTAFNILTILPALVSGVPVIKASQALGPFEHRLNRWMAKLILPRLSQIVARGAQTEAFLLQFGLTNVVRASDLAFSLECTDEDRKKAQAFLPADHSGGLIGISPSQVVDSLCRKCGVDYLGVLETVTRSLHDRGIHCVIFPHSAREGSTKKHNNDLPLVKCFAARIADLDRITVIEKEWEAGELRMLIASFDLLIASRFHAIVSAMATGVPAAVIGWSHKYAEVLSPFEMEKYVQSYADFSAEKTMRIVEELMAERERLSPRLLAEAEKLRCENRQFFDSLTSRFSRKRA